MKKLNLIIVLVISLAVFSSCDDGCKDCSINGDYIGEYCDEDQIQSVRSDGGRCK